MIADDLCIGKKIIYDGGEGLFTITQKIDKNKYIVKSEGNFIMADGKSITYGESIKTNFDLNIVNIIKPDYIAFSFVDDLEELKQINSQICCSTCIKIAKIETQKSVNNIEPILENFDGIMIARGDLALNVEYTEFYDIQKKLAHYAKLHHSICYIATDIMQSFKTSFVPSRSDLNDLFFFKSLLTDGLILSLQLSISENINIAIECIKDILDR